MPENYTQAEIAGLGRQIKDYLKDHSRAADTLGGFSARWQMATGQMVEQYKFKLALDQLCEQDWVHKRAMHDGTLIYVPNVGNKNI